jgi:hypothetical protein
MCNISNPNWWLSKHYFKVKKFLLVLLACMHERANTNGTELKLPIHMLGLRCGFMHDENERTS